MMITCPTCGKQITNIKQLSEVESLGLAMRGRCPKCEGWIYCNSLWKKTRFIDRTHPTASSKSHGKRLKARHINTPKARINALERVLEGSNK